MHYDFVIVDVFSDIPFGGNQLAVLTDAKGITTEGMQAIAREFNYPETTFVLPAADSAFERRLRIFTPGGELPFAGHPTVGTACALVMTDHCPLGVITLEEGVGPVPVTVKQSGSALTGRLRVSRAPEIRNEASANDDMAAILSLPLHDVMKVFCAGLGVNFTFVQVRSRKAVDGARLKHEAWSTLLAEAWGAQVFVFTGDLSHGAKLYARMFAPGLGIAEDPATGSAAAAIAGAAATFDRSSGRDVFDLNIEQGVAMGRPSCIRARALLSAGEVSCIEVEGSCAFVAKGQMHVPERFLEHQ